MPAPHGRDLAALRERLQRWLGARLPRARELTISELSGPGATGFSSDTLLFDLTSSEAGVARRRSLVLRLEPAGFRVFPCYDVGRQFRIQRRLGRSGIPVARALWLERDPGVLGSPFYVMERAEGRIPPDNPPYHADGWVTEIAPAERERIWWSGFEALAAIHRLEIGDGRFAFLSPAGGAGSPLEAQLEDYGRFLAWAARGRPQPTCEVALAWLRAERPRDPEPLALCWGDARIGNMVFREGRCVAVLDWEMATLANPVQDLAWWLFMDHHHSAGIGRPRLPGFPDREASAARWAELTGLEPRHLAYYEVFAAFRFSVIMIRVAQQMMAYGLLPDDSPFERDNTATRCLAAQLGLPAPGAT
jgi:aminoglycoside phosphotransferase (APT) family kinase protein